MRFLTIDWCRMRHDDVGIQRFHNESSTDKRAVRPRMQNPARYYGAGSLMLQCVFGRISRRVALRSDANDWISEVGLSLGTAPRSGYFPGRSCSHDRRIRKADHWSPPM